MLETLNFNHLFYFWVVAREGSIARASRRLLITPQTISAQVKALETSLGSSLFSRSRRSLELTEAGRHVLRYADEMFRLGNDLVLSLKGESQPPALKAHVGVPASVPSIVTLRLLKPSLDASGAVLHVFRQDRLERLVTELIEHRLDFLLSDSPPPAFAPEKVYSHRLGRCGVVFMAVPRKAQRYRKGFPSSLDGAPVLLPTAGAPLRRNLDAWLEARRIEPRRAGEFEDRSLLLSFGRAGAGVFPVPAAVEKAVARQFGVRRVGTVEGVWETFFALTLEKRVQNPLVLRIREAARKGLFQKRLSASA